MTELEIKGTAKKKAISMFRVTLTKGDGERIVRDMPVDVLIKILGDSGFKEERAEVMEVPEFLLTGEYIRYANIRYSEKKKGFAFAKVLPPERTGFLLYDKIPVFIPQPRRLVFYASEGQFEVFAIKTDACKRLYWYPLGHVQQSGYVCKGNLVMKASTLSEATKQINDFFIAGTEGHYFEEGKTIKENYSFGEMINILQGMDSFPTKWLQPARDYRGSLSLEDAWGEFLRRLT